VLTSVELEGGSSLGSQWQALDYWPRWISVSNRYGLTDFDGACRLLRLLKEVRDTLNFEGTVVVKIDDFSVQERLVAWVARLAGRGYKYPRQKPSLGEAYRHQRRRTDPQPAASWSGAHWRVTVSNATCTTADMWRARHPCGDTVVIKRAGEVIPVSIRHRAAPAGTEHGKCRRPAACGEPVVRTRAKWRSIASTACRPVGAFCGALCQPRSDGYRGLWYPQAELFVELGYLRDVATSIT